MKMRIVITPTGQIGVFADEGTFDQAKGQIESVLAALGAMGIEIAEVSPVEAHRHEHEGVHSHDHSHSEGG